jgi:malate dehydrogenase (oxaloacetate-decarboxylating)(NADP+)
MMTEGTSQEEAREKIWMVDIDGLLAKGRPEGKLGGHKWYYAKEHEVMKDFTEIVKEVQPSILIGASAVGGAFKPEILEMMGEFNERPIIFALSNPTHKAECTAQQAYTSTKGKCIFASGSPFGTVEYEGKVFEPGQGNNVSYSIINIRS